MELEAAYEALADYSLQEAPFYEAPLKVGPPQQPNTPQLSRTPPQQQPQLFQHPFSFRSALFGTGRRTGGGSMAASSLMINTNGGTVVVGGGKLMQHLNNSGANVPQLQQPPSRPPALISSSGGGLMKTKKHFKKSVSFLPTIVQVSV